MSSSRDHRSGSGSSSRKRDRSPEDRASNTKRSERDRDYDKERDRGDVGHSSSSSRHRSSRDADDDESRKKSSSSSSRREDPSSSRRDKGSSSSTTDRHDRSRDRDRDRSRSRDRDHGSRKSSRRDHDEKESRRDRRKESDRKDKGKSSSSRSSRHDGRSESDDDDSGSGSETGSSSGSEDESEDELIKKAKSMIQTISEDDYFNKSTEFRLWLRKSKKKYFEELTADENRKYFRKFVRAWNDYDLDESYYKGIRSSQIPSRETTKYQWGFAKKIGKDDQYKVDSVRDTIDTMTNTRFANEVSRLTGKSTAAGLEPSASARRTVGPSMPPGPSSRRPLTADEVAQKEEQDEQMRRLHRKEQKDYRKSKEVVMEELVPKATGREAMLEKRRAQTAYHRRERSPDVELPEQDLMGTGDDYKSLLMAEKRRKESRENRRYGAPAGPDQGPSGGNVGSVLEAKQAAFREKEEKQLEAFRQLWAQSQAAKGL
ncbi:hypothetical protein EMPS_09109 [Entomortierella parvispora]|uniref:Uncharacterized protein n=1 Tax=Entomortierella parvispora TaxID=205924 RepID=A0A9P3M0A0_9FUNG|nr:hypothetical protein EMPS_09109 [Entomortierella parvispora]